MNTETGKRKISRSAALILSCILFVFAVTLTVYYILGPFAGEFHSDCTDTICWANATVESGEIVSSTYYYSAILPFGGQLVMIPFIWIFGFSMKAHLAGMIVFSLILAAALFYFYRSAGMGLAWAFFYSAVTILSFFSSAKMREIFFGHVIYYSLGILFFAIFAGTAFRFFRNDGDGTGKITAKAGIYACLFFALSLFIASDGFQMIVLSTAPVFAAIAAELLLDGKRNFGSVKELKPVFFLAVGAVFTLAGLLLLKLVSHGVEAGYESGYSTYDDMGKWFENLSAFPKSFFTLIGVDIRKRDPVFSLDSAFSILRMVFGTSVLFIPAAMAVNYRRIKARPVRITVIAHLFVSGFVMFGFVFGNLSTANWRLIPMFGTAVITSCVCAWEMLGHSRVPTRISVAVSALILSAAMLSGTGALTVSAGQTGNRYLYELSDYLQQESLTYGYADYWESQAISLILGPDVKVRCVRFGLGNEIEMYPYQTDRNWYDGSDGSDRYFMILSSSDRIKYVASDSYNAVSSDLTGEEKVGDYYVMVFSSNPLGYSQ